MKKLCLLLIVLIATEAITALPAPMQIGTLKIGMLYLLFIIYIQYVIGIGLPI